MPKATYDDLIRVPDDKIAELIDGELNASPRRDGAFELVDTWTGNATVSTVPFDDFALDLSGIWLL